MNGLLLNKVGEGDGDGFTMAVMILAVADVVYLGIFGVFGTA